MKNPSFCIVNIVPFTYKVYPSYNQSFFFLVSLSHPYIHQIIVAQDSVFPRKYSGLQILDNWYVQGSFEFLYFLLNLFIDSDIWLKIENHFFLIVPCTWKVCPGYNVTDFFLVSRCRPYIHQIIVPLDSLFPRKYSGLQIMKLFFIGSEIVDRRLERDRDRIHADVRVLQPGADGSRGTSSKRASAPLYRVASRVDVDSVGLMIHKTFWPRKPPTRLWLGVVRVMKSYDVILNLFNSPVTWGDPHRYVCIEAINVHPSSIIFIFFLYI